LLIDQNSKGAVWQFISQLLDYLSMTRAIAKVSAVGHTLLS